MTRAATSTGADLDSWMADFSLTRLPGAAATGTVTLARYSPGLAAVIPVGTIVRTNDGTQSFAVIANVANPAWNGTGYTLAASAASVDLPVVASAAGSAGNVQAGAIGLLSAALPGVDSVTNALPFTGGVNTESDAAFRARFTLYINSRSLATIGAIDFAIASLQLGLRSAVLENVDSAGNAIAGNFCVIVDDGTGSPPSSLLANASAAVEAVRPIGTTYNVAGPAIMGVAVQMSTQTSNPLTKSAVVLAIQQAVQSWIAGLPIAGTLAISKLEAIAHATDASVISVSGTTINGSTSDVTAAANAIIQLISITVD
jgi:uncharacterized phage protein gp47/JayE